MKLFDKVDPVFNIDDEMNFLIKEIDKKLNEIKINDKQKRKYMVSKSKVRSIHSSLSIEYILFTIWHNFIHSIF